MSEIICKANNVYMVRHLERIDSEEDVTREELGEWNKIKKEYLNKVNPYLQKRTRINKIVENLEDVRIDHVICSPYIRCIQTAMLIVNSKDINVVDKTINIDYRLGEIFHSDFLFEKPLNLDTILSHSNLYISDKLSDVPHNLDLNNNKPLVLTDFESDEEYALRVKNVLSDLRVKYFGNLLIVTHADAYRQYNSAGRAMKYGEVYDIELPVEERVKKMEGGYVSNNYRLKYIKYKNKYLQLKNRL